MQGLFYAILELIMYTRIAKALTLLSILMSMAHAEPSQTDLGNKFKFLNIPLSNRVITNLQNSVQAKNQKKLFSQKMNEPSSVDLGMNHTPVLDQGMYGTCVTFAVTAAIDALRGEGDYYSQLCLLQLGNYLSKNSYVKSGWDGDVIEDAIQKIRLFGLIGISSQSNDGCGGLYSYPLDGIIPQSDMNIVEYKRKSENIKDRVVFDAIQVHQYFNGQEDQQNLKLIKTKEALRNHQLVIFSVLLQDTNNTMGLTRHMDKFDAWVVTPKIKSNIEHGEINQNKGHAMIITGYDDALEIIDDEGNIHRGFFKLRNSWGVKPAGERDDIGDNGDYYMSYEYFKLFTAEAFALSIIGNMQHNG